MSPSPPLDGVKAERGFKADHLVGVVLQLAERLGDRHRHHVQLAPEALGDDSADFDRTARNRKHQRVASGVARQRRRPAAGRAFR